MRISYTHQQASTIPAGGYSSQPHDTSLLHRALNLEQYARMMMGAMLFVLTYCWAYILCAQAADPPPTLFLPDLWAPNKNLTSLPTINRIDPPPELTITVKENPGRTPDDTITFTFDRVLISPDDVAIALLSGFKDLLGSLSTASGKDSSPLTQEFIVKDIWYRLELGWDMYSSNPLTMAELYNMIMKLHDLSKRYYMRQVTFKYLLAGKFHAIGRLRNAATPAPRRKMAVGPKYMGISQGYIEWSDYGQQLDYQTVANTVMGFFDNCWNFMVQTKKASSQITIDNAPFRYHDVGDRVEVEVSGPSGGQLNLEEVMEVTYYMVEFGRVFFMEEHQCVLINTYYPVETKVTGFLLKGEA